MTGREGLPRLAFVFLGAVLLSFLAQLLLRAPGPAPPPPGPYPLPTEDLRLALMTEDPGGLAFRLSPWPVYRSVADDVGRVARTVPSGAPAAVGAYASGWRAWEASHDREASAPGAMAVLVRPRALFDSSPTGAETLWRGVLPEALVGETRWDGNRLRERWRVACSSPCVTALLDPLADEGTPARGWSAIPTDPDALAWLRVNPGALESAGFRESWEGWAAAERFLDMPLRSALARALAGPAVLALEEPGDDGAPRFLAVVDLRDAEAARTILDKIFALGVVSEALEISRYRGVLAGTWRPSAASPLSPSAAVDGEVLMLSLHLRDLWDAVDRRRAGAGVFPAAARRLEGIGPGSWKSWSRSPFLAGAWEEILSRHPRREPGPPFEVRAVARVRDGAWIVESEGQAPFFAAEPILPTARAVVRGLRRKG